MRRLRVSALLLAMAMTLVACGGVDVASTESAEVAHGPVQADIGDAPPYGPGAETGKAYDYELLTHCGVEWARIDGVWWRTTRLDTGNASPPSGWGNPFQVGELRVVDDTTAVFSGGPDGDIKFKRTDIVEAPFTCA